MASCSYYTSMIVLTVNTLHDALDRHAPADILLVAKALECLDISVDELKLNDMWRFRDVCKEMAGAARQKTAFVTALTRDVFAEVDFVGADGA